MIVRPDQALNLGRRPPHRFMNIRYALILAVTTSLVFIGCTTDEGTRNEKHMDGLVQHRDWPRIRQIAEAEVKRQGRLWPDSVVYLPVEHEDKMWVVLAREGTPNDDRQRSVMLMIGDDGRVLAYKGR